MRDFDEFNITTAVLESFEATPDARLKTIMSSLVRHLHDFARDTELTFAEWNKAIEFLTRTGQMCNAERQEFILLSDTLGLSMLVDAINHRMPAGATETTVLGPFFVEAAPRLPLGADISGALTGVPLFVSGVVRNVEGAPIEGALVDVWHADDGGFYDVQQSEKLGGLAGRAQFSTNAKGEFYFRSIMPRYYPIPNDGPVGDMLAATKRHPNRPAHVHFMIGAEGYETLITHLFDAESPWLDSDAVFGVKNSLIARFTHEAPGVAPDGTMMREPYRRLAHDFGLKALARAR
ncbi:MAG: intradiol ring-cleavage dioxygenase [Beijerinckiaceae bacterium]|jgi:hydroxyquinol 1,2-dioxygenase|nr:intradiol ring-cleavage dioxygenase [Beijerinckiaceae bacterium]